MEGDDGPSSSSLSRESLCFSHCSLLCLFLLICTIHSSPLSLFLSLCVFVCVCAFASGVVLCLVCGEILEPQRLLPIMPTGSVFSLRCTTYNKW